MQQVFLQQERSTSARLSRQTRRAAQRRLAKALKRLPVVLGLLAAAPVAQAQVPGWQAAQSLNQAGIGGRLYGGKTAVDANGNTLVTGFFSGTVVVGGTTLTSAGGDDIFVGKLDTNGNWLWVRGAGGVSSEQGLGVAVDASGNVFVTGSTYSSSQFGNITLNVSGTHTFVAKLDAGGTWQWAKGTTGTSIDVGTDIATDASGNVAITGYTSRTANFGNTAITVSGNYYDGYVAKLDGAGNWLWAKGFGGSSSDQGSGVAFDASGNVFVTGLFSATAPFGSTSLTSAGGYDIFVAKLAANGTWSWVKQAGGSGYDQGNDLALDASGNVWAIASYAGTGSFGSTSLSSVGSDDIAVLKLTNAGAWSWAKSAGGPGRDQGSGIAIAPNGSALISGTFNGSLALGSTTLTSAGNGDNLVVASLSGTGAWSWAKNALGTGASVAADASGNAVLAGTFGGAASFGSTTLTSNDTDNTLFIAKTSATDWKWAAQGNAGTNTIITATAAEAGGNTLVLGTFTGSTTFGSTTLTSQGRQDGFVGKRDAAGNWLWVKAFGGSGYDLANGLALDASGNVVLTGAFTGTGTFGGLTLTSAAQYGNQLFVAKLDANGNWLWAKTATSPTATVQGTGVALDASGNVLLTGYFYGTANFGGTSLTSAAQYNDQLFVAKLDAAGSWLWAQTGTTTGRVQGASVQVDASGNVFVTGSYSGTTSFGSTSLTTADQYTTNLFVTKLSAGGSWQWAKAATGAGSVQGSRLALDASGSVFLTGYFSGTASFGGTSLASTGANSYTYNVFLAKLDGAGAWQWAKLAGGTDSQQSTDLVLDATGNPVLAGFFNGTATFGSTSLSSAGGSDAFVAKANASGSWLWAKRAGGISYDQANSLAITGTGDIVVGGYIMLSNNMGTSIPASASFDALTIAGPISGNTGFLATLASPLAIVSFTPDNGLAGTSVVLTGRGFTSVSSVQFNGTSAPGFVVNSATQITVSVPAGATTGPLSVTTAAGTATSARPFTVPADLVVSNAQPISGTYRNVTVTNTGTATLAGNLTVLGTLAVQSGGQLNAKTYVVAGSSFVLADGGTLSTGHPAGLAASGSTGSIQTTTRTFAPDANYVYGSAVAGSETGTGLPAQVRSLSVQDVSGSAPAGVQLTNDVAIAQVLRLDYDLATNGKTLTLLSTPTAGSALVHNNGGVVVGAATVQRAIDPTLNAGLGYRQFSAPVGNTTVADLATAGFVPVVNPAYNTSATPTAETPFPTVYGYDQSRLALANNLDIFDKGWVSPAALTDALAVGRGYTVNLPASEVVDFMGTLNNGDLAVPLSRNSDATAPAAGWQLLGNPYPAPLDLSLVAAADRVNLDAATYVSQSLGQYSTQYRAYVNGLSTNGANNSIVPSGQGFFVRVAAGQTTGSFTFRNSQRLTAFDVTTSVQRPTADARPQVHLALRGTGAATDAAIVYFESGATAGLDAQFDAAKLPNSTGLNLSTAATTGQALAIDGRALPTGSLTVPLNVYVPATGTYTLHAEQLLNLTNLRVYLRDLQLGTLTDLAQQPSYSFSQNAAFLGARFELVINPQTALATTAATSAQVAVYPNPARTVAYVELPAALGTQPVAAALLDALGREVRTATLAAQGARAHQLGLAGLPAGVYTLRLSTSAGVVAKRLVVE
ncbi:MAG TPA: T9SS type A sorting domain-containing protein [Hymenobacter sp.]|uniref:T9SS type A sorting domain-containing protein n=1 Tax=Hymenobacter sp. TaxID=1898978 RepID=UPI002D7FF2C2|nr:T9SS type A sorting domain-containing protein [Hymenobacter sp.]HET9502407.1 T9SS type A sorting domain-containing protein [Hymenobacter sp.]